MNNTTFWDVLIVIAYLTFLGITLAGTVYLIEERDWSMWTILLWLIIVSQFKIKAGGHV